MSFGMITAFKAGIEVKHCGICNNYHRCVLNYNKEVEDKKTGEKKLIPHRIWMHLIPNNMIDKVAQANGCKNYSHNRLLFYQALNNLRYLPYWE